MAGAADGKPHSYSEDYIRTSLASLETMPLPQLRAFWAERWGEAPSYRSRDPIMRAAAWKLQADVHGGLSAKMRRDLAELGAKFGSDRAFRPGPAVVLMPGIPGTPGRTVRGPHPLLRTRHLGHGPADADFGGPLVDLS
jgi:hypothetical protein